MKPLKTKFFLFNCLLYLLTTVYSQNFDFTTVTNKNFVTDVKVFRDTVWIASSGGIVLRKPDGSLLASYDINNGLPDNNIQGIFIDHLGNKWFNSHDLIMKFDKGEFISYDVPRNHLPSGLLSFGIDSEDRWWLGPLSGVDGLIMIDGSDTTNWSDTFDFPNWFVRDIERQGDKMWFTGPDAVYRFVNNEFEFIRLPTPFSSSSEPMDVDIDNENNVWVSGKGGVFMINENDDLTRYDSNNSNMTLAPEKISALSSDLVWVSHSRSTQKFDGNAWGSIESLSSQVDGIDIDENGTTYFGTKDRWCHHDAKRRYDYCST